MNIFKDTMSEMTYKQIEKLVEQDAIVLFSVGIIEEHGPHLPLGTDIYLAYTQSIYQNPIKRGRQADCKGYIQTNVNKDRNVNFTEETIC